MTELVSLMCPACGGKLQIAQNVTSIICQYCGTEHMVKHESGGTIMLEAYARCPVCGRNDKVEKVSAVIASQSHEISGVEQKTEVTTNAQGQKQTVVRDVPFTRKQISVLGQRLAAPQPPATSSFPPYPQKPSLVSNGKGISTIVTGAVFLIAALCGAGVAVWMLFQPEANYSRAEVNNIYVTFGIGVGAALLFSLLGGALVVGGILMVVRSRKQNPGLMAQYQAQFDAVKQEHARIQGNYERSMERWKNLYYCARDDCVFIPGENASAPVTGMSEYLNRLPPTSALR